MDPIRLRTAQETDVGRMLAVYAPYVTGSTATWEYAVPSRDEMLARLEEHRAQGFPWLVAEGAQGMMGYAYAGRFAQRRGYDWDAELSIYLSQDARGNGIGKALYAALLALLAKQGYCRCYALVTHPNEASEAFHRALGFREEARLEKIGYKLGRWLDLSYYSIALREPPVQPRPPRPLAQLDEAAVRTILDRAAAMIR